MVSQPTFCVSIDLDDLRYYRAIHALPPVEDTPIIFEKALPRFFDLCNKVGLKATLFTISMDLQWDAAKQALKKAIADGHEIASHSHSHFYNLSQLDRCEIITEVAGSKTELETQLEITVKGFRGPGYNLSPTLLSVLAEAGFTYDASILPSPPYWAARASIIAGMRLLGQRSSSIPGRGRDFFKSRNPSKWPNGLIEYPITACGPAMMPLIGTTITSDSLMRNHIVRCAKRLPFVQVEFHAIDFLDIVHDKLDPALAIEPALKVPLSTRLASFEHVLSTLALGRQTPVLAEIGVKR